MPVDPYRVRELFLAAMDLPVEKRSEFIFDAKESPSVVAEVERLLAANADPDSLLGPLSPGVLPHSSWKLEDTREHAIAGSSNDSTVLLDPDSPTDRQKVEAEGVGALLAGRYLLDEILGQGGMGTVYRATQTRPVKREVALKLIRPGLDSKSVLARFDAERQALAMMDHPNIARIYDGGVTSSGQPFFVMELVRGVPLTEYCDQKKLPVAARLQLFVAVCQAVQHAHQKGIIHRDLKPGNVLVTEVDGRPTPKVIDFGVAKATEQRLTDLSLLEDGVILGTPAYMSPEQADPSSSDIDTRTDVYALGVILYEILTGSPPIESRQFKLGAILEMLRMVREVEPPRPSTRLSTAHDLPSIAASRSIEPDKLARLLKGELDWVVMKALEKDRARRYDTANAFAADIVRYLADEVVEARPPSWWYRAKKFSKRNKVSVIAAGLVLFAVLAGITGTGVGLVQANEALLREAARAEGERLAKNDAIESLKRAEQATQAEKEAKTRAIQFRDQAFSTLRATTSSDVEKLLGAKRDFSKNERDYLEAIAARWQALTKEMASDPETRSFQAEGHSQIGSLCLKLGRFQEAITEFQASRDLRMEIFKESPDVPSNRRNLAAIRNDLATLLHRVGKRDESKLEFEATVELYEPLYQNNQSNVDFLWGLASTHNNFGMLLSDMSEWGKAEAEYRLARNQYLMLLRLFPDNATYQQALASCHNNFAALLAKINKPDEALKEYQASLEIKTRLIQRFKGVPQYGRDLSSTLENMGTFFSTQGKRADAHKAFQMSRQLKEALVKTYPSVTNYAVELGANYCNYGNLVRDEGNFVESLKWYGLAVQTLQPVVEKETRDATAVLFLRNSHWNRAITFDRLKKSVEADRDLNRALALSTPGQKLEIRAKRLTSLVNRGKVAEAVTEVEELTKSSNWNMYDLYNFACIYSNAAGQIAGKKQEYSDRAMKFLQQAVQGGWKDAAHIRNDTDFANVRDRDDFKKLLTELDASSTTQPKPKPGNK